MPGPPPSFSSFPDLSPSPPSTKEPRRAPPSFSSFPSTSTSRRSPSPPYTSRDSSSRPAKRARADDFLDSLADELGTATKPESGRTSRHDSKRTGRSDDYSRDKRNDRDGRERDREHSSKSKKEKHRATKDDTDYGDKRKMPYQLLKTYEKERQEDLATPTVPPPQEARLFYVSKQGDELNIRYGGLHKGDIPKYRRIGAGRVVGLNGGLRITRESAYTGRPLEIASNTTYKTPRYVDPRSARHTTNTHSKRLKITSQARQPPVLGLGTVQDLSTPSDPFLDSSADPNRFVRFDPEPSLPERLERLEHEEGQDYRSITGLVKPSDLVDDQDQEQDDDAFDGAGITGGESHDEYLKRRNLELDRALRAAPGDVDTWLEFVNFQDEVSLTSFVGLGSKRALSKAERSSTSEIKLSILDRALAVDANKQSEKLLLAYLQSISDVWDPKVVLEKWTETLKKNPSLTGLWIEYVSWRQTSWATFEVRKVVECYVECFAVLKEAMAGEKLESPGRELLEGNAIYLFLRLCLMLRQAGFAERALAAFQNLIELTFFRPDSLARPEPRQSEEHWLANALDELELFWESGGPRIGEPTAKGWKHTSEDVDPPVAAPPPVIESLIPSKADAFERWAEAERATAQGASLPARADDPGVDDDVDPFRVVLFDDVRDFLVPLISPDSKVQLAYAFLTFLGLPFVPPDFPTTTPFTTDPFIHSELAERPGMGERFWPKTEKERVPFQTIEGEAMEPERRSALASPFDAPFRTTPVAVDCLFGPRQRWFQTLTKDDLGHVDCDFVRNVFDLLRPSITDPFFTLSLFAFEAAQSPKIAAKLAKQVLRDNRQNLLLWDGYARIERQRGKVEEARAVYVTALSMYRTFESRDQIDGPLLWRAWAEMEWEEAKPMMALQVLVAAAGSADSDLNSLAKKNPDTRPSPAQILRARQYYTAQLEAAFQAKLSQSTLRNRNHMAFSAALFEYIAQGLTPSIEVLERHLFRLDGDGASGSAEHEEAYMLLVKLLYRHSTAGKGYKPGQLSSVLERAIKEFPSNSLFLGIFYHNELRMKIQNRVRRVLEESVLGEKVVTSQGWLFAIFSELHLDARSPNVWGVRNLFDRAVDHPKTRCSPSLWILYIDFEIRNKELHRAKLLVYRALRECPWVKELYLKPFCTPLRSQYRSVELRQMYTLLVSEKGLRGRCELDTFLEGQTFSDDELPLAVDDDDDGVRETEQMFAERRKLLPY